jgi:hypothetical protein
MNLRDDIPLPAASGYPKRFRPLWWRLARNRLDRHRPHMSERFALVAMSRNRNRVFVRRPR